MEAVSPLQKERPGDNFYFFLSEMMFFGAV